MGKNKMENNQHEKMKILAFFEEVSRIPRKSGDEQEISDYLMEFAEKRGLECQRDMAKNIIIKKPASGGYENVPAFALQAHMDMVYVREDETKHTYGEPLMLYEENGLLKARGTSLGADNGIGMAMILAVLDAKKLCHPTIEAIFTAEEEDGLLGASKLDPEWVSARRLINLDGEEEHTVIAGCAGAFRSEISIPCTRSAEAQKTGIRITVGGFAGGHSGLEIEKQHVNAILFIGRILADLYYRFEIKIVEIGGGTRMNNIPSSAWISVCCNEKEDEVLKRIAWWKDAVMPELSPEDREFWINAEAEDIKNMPFDEDSAKRIIQALALIPNGMQRMSAEVKGLVETSNNVGVIETCSNKVIIVSNPRSSLELQKEYMEFKLCALAQRLNGSASIDSGYPVWEYAQESALRELYLAEYKKRFQIDLKVAVLHGGLECGVLCQKYPGMDAISIGPDIFKVHSIEEAVSVSSLERVWKVLIGVLENYAE
ncbi:MAG: beta-Ala-His dipeptidase [Christensenella sp.]|nr:beta-Ala-His dipeptidase [Christensenella sp.]